MWWPWRHGVIPPFFIRLTVAKSNFASITWHENHICVAPCFIKSLAVSLASLPLPYSLGPLSAAHFLEEKYKMSFNFPCNLYVKFSFFSPTPEWIQSPQYVSAHKIRLVQTLSAHCSRASRCLWHSVLWPEEAIVTRKRLLNFPGKADIDHRCSFIRELANLNIGKHVHTTILTFTPS